MKTIYALLLLAVLAIPSIATASSDEPKGKHTKEKKIKKEYNVQANAQLIIDNSYGNVNIISWTENRVVIEVHVKTNGSDENKVQDKLDQIDVRFEANPTLVSAKTIFNKESSRSWWNSWKSSNVNMEINYTIKLPVTNAIDISNDYGGVTLDRIEGNAEIHCDYGKLSLGELLGDNNYLNFDYTKSSTIEYMKNGRIHADYSSFTLELGGDIELDADYSKSEFGKIENLDYSCDYGSINTNDSKSIRGRGDYLSVKIGTVHGNVYLRADYGSIRIDQMARDAGDLDIHSDYTGIKVGYHPEYAFNFNIKLEYAGLTGKEDLSILKERKESSESYFEGYHLHNETTNTLNINSEYGGVTLIKN